MMLLESGRMPLLLRWSAQSCLLELNRHGLGVYAEPRVFLKNSIVRDQASLASASL